MKPINEIDNRKRIHNDYMLDVYGAYWYMCGICGERLNSDWCLEFVKLNGTGEIVALCPDRHNKQEREALINIVESPLLDILPDKPRGN